MTKKLLLGDSHCDAFGPCWRVRWQAAAVALLAARSAARVVARLCRRRSGKPRPMRSQTVEVAGITYESVAHGTFYRGDAKKQDGFTCTSRLPTTTQRTERSVSLTCMPPRAILRRVTRCLLPARRPCSTTLQSEAPDELHEDIDLSKGQISVRARPLVRVFLGA